MSLLGNIVWLIFGGLLTGLGYIVAGFLMCLTIIGIPLGIQSMRVGVATFAPFGKQVVEDKDANGPLQILLNIVWIVFFGWEIAVAHLFHAGILAITIIGIPFALQHLKLIPIALLPLGRSLRRVA